MATNIKLTAADGHKPGAYYAAPADGSQSAVIVIQEIFGVNSHIRSVADDFASEGFHAVAPALFDRVEPGVELSYNAEDTQRGMRMATKIGMENALQDVAAAFDYARAELGCVKAGVVGYCFGGSLAWLAATRLGPAAAVGYYGGRITQYLSERPLCPVMLHFGWNDPHIPPTEIDKIRLSYPELPIYMYRAGHGFNCDQRKDYEPESAKLARERTLEFLGKYL
jgi:carboxymethylenebutenolidase